MAPYTLRSKCVHKACVWRRGVYTVPMKPTTKTAAAPTANARRAVVYLRVSTEEQAASGLGLEAQEAACRAFCEAEGWTVASIHVDASVSGTAPVDGRPALAEALGSLARGGVLVAARRDRIARSVGVAAVVEETARRRGARVVTPDAPGEADDPFAGAMRGMMDVFAQLERALIATRTRAALAAKRARGEKTGGDLPVGAALAEDGVTLTADTAEAAAVDTIRDLRAAGMSVRAIAAELDARGIPARGERWHATTVARVLKRTAA